MAAVLPVGQHAVCEGGVGVSPLDLLAGLVFTVIAGYLAIVLVKKLVLTMRFHYFAAYGLAVGVILITLTLLGF